MIGGQGPSYTTPKTRIGQLVNGWIEWSESVSSMMNGKTTPLTDVTFTRPSYNLRTPLRPILSSPERGPCPAPILEALTGTMAWTCRARTPRQHQCPRQPTELGWGVRLPRLCFLLCPSKTWSLRERDLLLSIPRCRQTLRSCRTPTTMTTHRQQRRRSGFSRNAMSR